MTDATSIIKEYSLTGENKDGGGPLSSGALIDVDVVGASKGRMNVIDLDFGFGFWKEHGDY